MVPPSGPEDLTEATLSRSIRRMTRFLDVRHVMAVQDLAASTEYYTRVLRFQRDPIDAPRWSFLSRDGVKLMLGECADEVAAAETGSHSWMLRIIIEGLDEFHHELKDRGVEVLIEPSTRAYGLREFVIRTPDGHRIMFAEAVK